MNNTQAKSKYVTDNKSIMGNVPEMDGITHIDIHSMGRTELGKLLSHFAHLPFTHPYFGPFYSMEGFWYYARCGFNETLAYKLRYLSGLRAKRVGIDFKMIKYDDFQQDIIAANYQKIIQNDHLRELMINSDLPFDHYYIFKEGGRVVTPREAEWLIQGFEDIRFALKEGVVPSVWLEAEKRYLEKK